LPEEQLLCLSDAFTDEQGNKKESCLELTVRVLNINYGYNKELMDSCKRLKEYAQFVAKVRELHEKGYSMEQSTDMAVAYCIRNGIMKDILQPFRAEVKKMLLTEYDEKKTMRLFRKEAKDEGIAEGIEKGIEKGVEKGRNLLIVSMFQNGIPVKEIAKISKLSIQEIERILTADD